MQDIIVIKDLSFGYVGTSKVLKKINLKIEEGKFTCIIGENGSGKSTLLKCIVGLIKNYTGKIEVREKIGYLPQKNYMQNNFPASIEEVVLSGRVSSSVKKIFYSKEDRNIASDVMKELGIYDIRKKSYSELSGGQQQRVLIARAMCASEKLIILDEPTNGLDPNIARQIYSLLDTMKKKRNLTVLMVSHDVERALKFADNVIEMVDGKVNFAKDASLYNKGGDKK